MAQTASAPARLALVTDPPMSRHSVMRVALAGFAFLVGLVLLAAWLGYQGSDRIQETAQALVREKVIQSPRAAEIEALIVRESQQLIDNLAWVLGLCILLAMGTGAMTVWILQRAFARLEWQATELAHVSWHMIDTHEKMARRFSHEMHDELGQSLSALRRMLSRVSESDVVRVRQEALMIVDEVLQSVRKLSQVLRPVILDDFGLDSGLRWLCDRFTERTQISVTYSSDCSERLAENAETHLFRIAQEALTNIARHAEATNASVSLRTRDRTIELEVMDNGRGIHLLNEAKAPSLGMVGMRARARQLGGELLVQNQKKGGLRLVVQVPREPAHCDAEQENSSSAG